MNELIYLLIADSKIVDVSRQPKKEKFSFIYTLSLSGSSDLFQQARYPEPNLNSASTFTQQELPAKAASQARERSKSNLSKDTNSEQTSESSAVGSALAAPDDTATTITAQWYQIERAASSYDLGLSTIAASSAIPEALEERSQPNRNYLSKILLVCSCGYLILVMGWLFGHHSEYFSVILRGKQPVVLSKSDAEFIDYMERSLSSIDNQASQQDLVAGTNKDSQVIYVPVFTPQASAPNTPSPITLPSTSMAKEPTAAISQPLPLAPPPESVKIPSPPPLPAPTPISDANVSDYSTATATPSKPMLEHTLIGILELGDKSAALFEIEGAIEQVRQGQEINSSGWILDSVNDRKVQISYQEQVRTLSVGEKF